ncbi:MAG: hypothetical protein HY840_15940 [Bacteroidetes bacterium]|nr:hypothetical protein [Bacteroidota bacterium]
MKKKEKKPTVSFRPTSEEHQTLKAFAKAAHNVSVAKYCEEHFRSFLKEHMNTLKTIHAKEHVSGKTSETHKTNPLLNKSKSELSDLNFDPDLISMSKEEYAAWIAKEIPKEPCKKEVNKPMMLKTTKVELGGTYKIQQEPCKKEVNKPMMLKTTKVELGGTYKIQQEPCTKG